MSFKKWKDNELGTLLTEKWGFSFNLLTESQDEEVIEEEEDELEEGASSSGRAVTPDRGGEDRRANDERKRPMEEAEKPDFPDVDGDGDRKEPISKASKEKKGDDGDDKEDKEDKSDKSDSKIPPQLRKHVKGKVDEAKIRRIIRKLVKEAAAKKAR
jgi:hypothetical protein